MHPFDYVVHETNRQSGTMREAVGMFCAWEMFMARWDNGLRLDKSIVMCAIKSINDIEGHRIVPAVFNQGMPAVPPGAQLERAMQRWYDLINSSAVDPKNSLSLFDTSREMADFVTREFLLIHPFADGNGRIGSLVWNFLNETIMDPEPMPYFFNEEGETQ